MWGSLPYISKDTLEEIVAELPEHDMPGRSGAIAPTTIIARICRVSAIRTELQHLRDDGMDRVTFNNVCAKYKNLPDNYYGGVCKPHRPEQWSTISNQFKVEHPTGAQMWEWYAGSAALSTWLRANKVVHLPPYYLLLTTGYLRPTTNYKLLTT